MFNLGLWEIFILAAVALVVVGPEKLPKLARDVARFLNEVKRTTNSITSEMNKALDEEEFQKTNLNTNNDKEEIQDLEDLGPEDPLRDLKNSTEDKNDV
jgi:sec-independent protein translocase protein TatB